MSQDHGGGQGADQDDYEPRRHDALIEPLFGGLESSAASHADAARVARDVSTPSVPSPSRQEPAESLPRAGRGAWAARSLVLFAALLTLAALAWLARTCAG
jgi:hypothetical protein